MKQIFFFTVITNSTYYNKIDFTNKSRFYSYAFLFLFLLDYFISGFMNNIRIIIVELEFK